MGMSGDAVLSSRVEIVIEMQCRLFISIMFMFSCLYNYYSGSEEGGGQGSSVSFSEKTETQGHAMSFPFLLSAPPCPLFPLTPLSSSCSSPQDLDPSLPLL